MRLASYRHKGVESIGIVAGGGIIDLASRTGDVSMQSALADLERARRHAGDQPDVAIEDIEWLPPVPRPIHVVGVGLNTRSHFEETAAIRNRTPGDYPKYPRLFLRSPRSQVGTGQPLWVPRVSTWLDYEGEIAVVFGSPTRYVDAKEAMTHVAGLACYNDGSVRDYQGHTDQTTAGKSFPHTGGFGPWLTTLDAIPDLEDLTLETRVNGEVRQRMTLADLIFAIPDLIAYVSQIVDIQPGDVLITGSPAGVGAITRRWLQAGDVVEVDVSGLGVLTNLVADEPR